MIAKRRVGALTVVAAALCSGCSSIGPETIARDRFDYSAAITESWKRQTLLNIVKIRYLDPPIFVDVGQIVSGYSLETTANAAATFNFPNAGDSASILGQARFTDRPTITYVPLTGNRFVAGLMTPIPPESLFSAIQSGWPANAILSLGVAVINGLRNEEVTIAGATPPDPRFVRVAELMRSLQMAGQLSIRVTRDAQKGTSAIVAIRAREPTPEAEREIVELRELLGLEAGAGELALTFGGAAESGREIAVITRSMLHIITALAARAEIPAEDIAEGRAAPGTAAAAGGFRILCSDELPKDASVAVPYRGHWFWIDDRDLISKRAFAFIMLLFSLSESSNEQGMPVITIPAQ